MSDDDESCACWILDDESLRAALESAAAGEPIDLILLAMYANSDIEVIHDDDDE